MKAFITDDVNKGQTDSTDTIMPPAAAVTYSTLKNKLGKETFLGEWYLIDQRNPPTPGQRW